MNAARNLGNYLKAHNISVSELSKKTGFAYQNLYTSLSGKRDRDLRAEELLGICKELDLDPMDFYDASDEEEDPEKISIGGCSYSSISVVTDDGAVVASISGSDIIEKQGYKVVCTPFVD